MNHSERQIQERTEIFVAEITDLLRLAALETVTAAIEGATGAPTRSRPRTASAGPERPFGDLFAAERVQGKKRSKEELEQFTASLDAYIKNNAGQRAEPIAKAMGVATKDLQLPVRKLIEAGAIITQGRKRSTQYFPENSERSA